MVLQEPATSGLASSTIATTTLNKSLPPIPASDEESTPSTQSSPHALRELDILLRDSSSPNGQEVLIFFL